MGGAFGQGGGGMGPGAALTPTQQLIQGLFGPPATSPNMSTAQPLFGGASIPPATGPTAPTPTPPAGSGVSTGVSPAMYPTQMSPPLGPTGGFLPGPGSYSKPGAPTPTPLKGQPKQGTPGVGF